ncbi:helix-turn-helix domain-containing protein [Niastella koreensis]|nr:AraC family transcriptional regulator [Niastella koreensis]
MAESIAQLPVTEHNRLRQLISTNNQFFKGVMHYRQAAEGLWILATEMAPEKDLVSRALYDATLTADYYFLSFAVFEYRFPLDETGNAATLRSTTCTFYKPRTEVATFFYTGSTGRFYNIAFTRNWVEQHLVFSSTAEKEKALQFLNNETGFLNWIDIVPAAETLSTAIWQQLQSDETPDSNPQWFADTLHQVIGHFFQAAFADKRLENYSSLYNKDYAKVALAEKQMLNNLHKPFAGVDAMAKTAGMSPTKLKAIFKSVFGFSMLQYHKEKNLLFARQLVQRSPVQVKIVAAIAGYKTVNKFSAAYKKRFGVLPTEDRRTVVDGAY